MLHFHLEVLNSELEKRVRANKRYSARAFARDIGVSPSLLSEVLRLKKGFSFKKANQIASKLKLQRAKHNAFLLSIAANFSRRETARAKFKTELLEVLQNKNIKIYDEYELSNLGKWYYNVLLELCELSSCENTIEWFAKKTGLTLFETNRAIAQLIKLNQLKLENQKYSPVYDSSETSFEIPSEIIKSLHKQNLEMAQKALVEQDIASREFLFMTFAFNRGELAEAKRDVRKFQEDFAKKYYSKNKTPNAIYNLSIQFFRQDKD